MLIEPVVLAHGALQPLSVAIEGAALDYSDILFLKAGGIPQNIQDW